MIYRAHSPALLWFVFILWIFAIATYVCVHALQRLCDESMPLSTSWRENDTDRRCQQTPRYKIASSAFYILTRTMSSPKCLCVRGTRISHWREGPSHAALQHEWSSSNVSIAQFLSVIRNYVNHMVDLASVSISGHPPPHCLEGLSSSFGTAHAQFNYQY